MNAQERLVTLLKASFESVTEKYELTAGTNVETTSSELLQSLTSRYASAVVKNCRVIKTSTYDLPNGKVQIYVCIESGDTRDEVSTGVTDVLSENGIKSIMAHRDQFKKEVEEKLRNQVVAPTVE
jgi:hypothetical protein